MENSIPTIQAVLQDVEMRQVKEGTVRFWLKMLEDVAYGVKDEISAETMPERIEAPRGMMTKVINFFSLPNLLAFRLKIAHKIREIDGRLGKTEGDMKMLNFIDLLTILTSKRDREIDAHLDDPEIVGRERDKLILTTVLIGFSSQEILLIILMVGIGGLGNTTLGKFVPSDE